jgi:hypothetical protein
MCKCEVKHFCNEDDTKSMLVQHDVDHGTTRAAFPKLFSSGDQFYYSECSTDRPTLVPFESKLFKILNYSV